MLNISPDWFKPPPQPGVTGIAPSGWTEDSPLAGSDCEGQVLTTESEFHYGLSKMGKYIEICIYSSYIHNIYIYIHIHTYIHGNCLRLVNIYIYIYTCEFH